MVLGRDQNICLDELKLWLTSNFLSLNESKTECIFWAQITTVYILLNLDLLLHIELHVQKIRCMV